MDGPDSGNKEGGPTGSPPCSHEQDGDKEGKPRVSRIKTTQADPRVRLGHAKAKLVRCKEEFERLLADSKKMETRHKTRTSESINQPSTSPDVEILTSDQYMRDCHSELAQKEPAYKSMDEQADAGSKRSVREAPASRKLLRLTREEKLAKKTMFGSERAVLEKVHFEREFDHDALLATLVSDDLRHIYKHNPHLRQVFVGCYDLYRVHRPFCASDRFITAASEQTRRRGRFREVKTVEHWGQRKLLLSEIEFLTEYYSLGRTIVYVGAAPGNHINFLASVLFPKLHFVLIDPAPFEAWETANVEIKQEYFTDDIARTVADKDSLLISDVRAREVDDLGFDEREAAVLQDMELQKGWVQIMRPVAASLKFRLPWLVDKYPTVKYLDGKIYFPIWGPRTTSETRLFVSDPTSEKVYDSREYDDIMFHFNVSTRVSYFEERRSAADGFDHCYDCTAEDYVLRRFFSRMHGVQNERALRAASAQLSDLISAAIGSRNRNTVNWGGGLQLKGQG